MSKQHLLARETIERNSIEKLIEQRDAALVRVEEHEASFKIRWDADMRAIKRWQEAHPGKEDTWPDHADLCVWLLVRVETVTAALREAFNCITITAHHLKIQEKRRVLDDAIIARHAEVEAKLKQVMISAPADTTSTAVRIAQPATGAPHEKQEDRG